MYPEMELAELIKAISHKHSKGGIEVFRGAKMSQIRKFESAIGFPLPPDFIEFYSTCNGFGCTEDIFNMISLENILTYQHHHKGSWFYFAEYMIFSDMWGLRYKGEGNYEIFNGSYPDVALTSSMNEFLSHFLAGNVFDPGGLYEWQKQLYRR